MQMLKMYFTVKKNLRMWKKLLKMFKGSQNVRPDAVVAMTKLWIQYLR